MTKIPNPDIGAECNVTVLTLEISDRPPMNPNFPFIVIRAGEADRLYVKFHSGECVFSVARSDVSFPETQSDIN